MISTSLCIHPDLSAASAAKPQTVYCAVTLAVLGMTEGPIERDPDGTLRMRAFGVDLVAKADSQALFWRPLLAVDVEI